MRVLVTAASRYGTTGEIAKALAVALRREGHQAECQAIERVRDLGPYDAVVLGSAVYYGRWLEPARELVRRHAGELAEKDVWLFSSGPVGEPGHRVPEDATVQVAELAEATGAIAHRIFPGRLDRARLHFRDRAVAAALRVEEGDFRDRAAEEALAHEIAEHLRDAPVPAGAGRSGDGS